MLADNIGITSGSEGVRIPLPRETEIASPLKRKLAPAWYHKGNALSAQGKYEEAIKVYDEAIRLDPKLADALCHKGNALSARGKYDEAIKAYDEAIRARSQTCRWLVPQRQFSQSFWKDC